MSHPANTRLNWFEVAWAAGFFDGEGNIRWRIEKYRNPNRSRRYGTVQLQIGQIHRSVLNRFANATQQSIKHVRGPYKHKGIKNPYYQYSVCGMNAVNSFKLIREYLSPIKKNQGDEVLKKLNTQLLREPLGNGYKRKEINRRKKQ